MAITGGGGSFGNGHAAFDQAGGTAAAAWPPAAPEFGARQQAAPGKVIGAGDLGIDEAVDALMADDGTAMGALVSQNRLVRFGCRPVVLQFPADGRWRAIQTSSDLPDRAALGLKPGKLDPLIQ
jgi:hypothetical protein